MSSIVKPHQNNAECIADREQAKRMDQDSQDEDRYAPHPVRGPRDSLGHANPASDPAGVAAPSGASPPSLRTLPSPTFAGVRKAKALPAAYAPSPAGASS